MSSLRLRKPSEAAAATDAALGRSDSHSPTIIHRRRWRLAFTVIYFTRALESLSKRVLGKKTDLLRSLSFVAINVDLEGNDNPREGDRPLLQDANPKILSNLVREKELESLAQLGGIKQLASILMTNPENGLSGDEADLIRRTNVFGANKYIKPPAKSFLSFVLDAFKDMTIIILIGCAVLSLAFGIKQHGLKEGWYDGGSIIIAIFLVVIVSALSNYKQGRQFEKLSKESSNIRVEVVRDGRRQPISIFDIVVGDVVFLKIGDQVPADGLLVDGHSLRVDESSMTGESDHIEVDSENPFLLSGTKVIDGYGRMMVASVGMNTAWGEMMSSVSRVLDEETPLQARLNKLTSFIGKIGLSVAILVLLVLMIRYFTGNTQDEAGRREFTSGKTKSGDVMDAVVRIVAAAVTIVVVAIPEGLPLAVTLTLAYSMKRMMNDNAMVRKLSACETMGSATTICTDKTGTLTLNEMRVTELWMGKEHVSVDASREIAPSILEVLLQGIGMNTTGTVHMRPSASVPEILGSPTEKAILSWGVSKLGMKMDELKQEWEIIQVEAFNSEKKRSGVAVRRSGEQVVHIHWKGAAEMILALCSDYYSQRGTVNVMTDEARSEFGTIIKNMAGKSLRCIAFAYKKFNGSLAQVHARLEEDGLTLLGIIGIKDPCRPGVRRAVVSCKCAGVNIKMITGDNVHTARAIALECGIFNPDEDLEHEAIVEGVQFRNYSPEQRMAAIEKIRVMARSSPFDKLLMVQSLKQKGHVVAVTGDGTNDAPALKEADIGLSMGIQGTEVAKESSDIVILDDNFASVATVLRWGRCVYNNIQKFIQFQLTVNVAALVINFVAAVSAGDVPLTAVQLLWVNLIMDTLGALALATEQPTNDLMLKTPVGRTEPLISRVMWRNLVSQALYQVIVLLTLQFKGSSIFGVDKKVKNTIIFNCFVLCQVFNEFNARKLEEKNVFKGIHKNKLFLGIISMTIILQVVMVEFLKRFANTERLDWGQWGACIGLASLSWPIGWLVKCIPVSGKNLWFSRREEAS
ncbi:calcium-transporting ATPase 12, plasma membrane-type-like [Syzygium oleosum]|uniref:calcium-transporting ATPase 12, plasma membrane-type-like n=1 Tax=Syzygium oleosum TaxID=219896 RepID=UPI0011D235C7|nr:calcium-transporting ATPase 12, plasma membrane-type-like [Syzygium oleosum]